MNFYVCLSDSTGLPFTAFIYCFFQFYLDELSLRLADRRKKGREREDADERNERKGEENLPEGVQETVSQTTPVLLFSISIIIMCSSFENEYNSILLTAIGDIN